MKRFGYLFALFAACFLFRMPVQAQGDAEIILPARSGNNLYFTLLGDASIVSLNYERLFPVSSSFMVAGKVGAGINGEFDCYFVVCDMYPSFAIPHHVTGNLGGRRHFLEFGLGGTALVGGDLPNYIFYPQVGYRLQPLDSGRFIFRIFGSLPSIGFGNYDMALSPVGISGGISF